MRNKRRLPTSLIAGLSIALAGLSVTVTGATASEPRVVVANVRSVPGTDAIVTTPISTSFDVVLRQPDQAALAAYIASLSDTASPNYHHYLTPSQFAQRFGATSATISAVRHYLEGYGLRVDALSKGHITMHVTGSTPDIARAFATPVETVRTGGGVLRAQFASAATLPAPIARDVTAVAGLSTVVAPSTPSLAVRTSKVSTPTTCPSAGSGTGTTPNSLGGYTAQQQAQLYGLASAYTAGDTGAGQTIAVYELGGFNQGSVATYFSCYGLTTTPTTVNVDGGIASGYGVGSPSEEATLDIEEAAVLAPGAAIEVYQGPNGGSGPTDVYQQIADDNTASIVSTSWGTCESDPSGDTTAEQAIFEQMAAQGQTVIASAGDNGSSDCYGVSGASTQKGLAVDDPASQPYVTGVGGLTISSVSPLTQTVWNSGAVNGAGGGGVSSLWSRPTWQSAPGIASSETMRMVPDLSVMGDPNTGFIEYYTGSGSGVCHRSCSTGWNSIGGTSIGSPIVSALVAVAAQSCQVSRLGFINPTLYAMASAGQGFIDVTTGNNDIFSTGSYSAGAGYDMASGLGSPNGPGFISGLCPAKFSAALSTFSTLPQSPLVNATSNVTALLKNVNQAPLANALLDVTASATAGTILLNGDATSSTSPGKSSYQVATDSTGTANIAVTSDTVGPVTITLTYAGQTVYTTLIDFAAAKVSPPGAPTIRSLTPLIGGFRLVVTPPQSTGGSAITAYQFSIDGGHTWSTFSSAARSVQVSRLLRSHTYSVVVRARNIKSFGAPSRAARVTTLA